MNERVKTLSDQATQLSSDERVELLDRIHASLLADADQVADRWDREAEERFAAFERGEMKSEDWEEIKKRYHR